MNGPLLNFSKELSSMQNYCCHGNRNDFLNKLGKYSTPKSLIDFHHLIVILHEWSLCGPLSYFVKNISILHQPGKAVCRIKCKTQKICPILYIVQFTFVFSNEQWSVGIYLWDIYLLAVWMSFNEPSSTVSVLS